MADGTESGPDKLRKIASLIKTLYISNVCFDVLDTLVDGTFKHLTENNAIQYEDKICLENRYILID